MKAEMIDYLRAGLQATSARQSLIANNIANLNTPGYRRRGVQFERALAEALSTGKDIEEVMAPIVTNSSIEMNEFGNDVDLDQEVGEMVKNTAMYKTYFRMLGKMMRQMEMAIGQ